MINAPPGKSAYLHDVDNLTPDLARRLQSGDIERSAPEIGDENADVSSGLQNRQFGALRLCRVGAWGGTGAARADAILEFAKCGIHQHGGFSVCEMIVDSKIDRR